ncbi:MAG: TonB-dependent receptor [Deltaproteobacteria bacterium]|nr:MAG: TonB-dependent receptor [Deltaproteobacteria bacterium]
MKALLCLSIVGFMFDAYSDDLIISATRYQSTREKTASSVVKLDVSKFKSKKPITLGEVLETVPQVYLNESGPGGVQTVHLRGSETSHVLVVLDGLPLNDPINTSKLFDFSKITLIGIESVEVLFGSHGVLYGSEAIGGVIYIKTLNPTRILSSVETSWGSHKTINHKALIGNKKGRFNGFIGIERFDTQGFNATTSTSNNPAEPDGSELVNLATKVGYEFDNTIASLSSRLHLQKTDLDKGFGSERDDTNFTSDDRFHYHLLTLKSKTSTQLFSPEMKIGYSDQKRENLDLPDSLSTSTDTQLYHAKSTDLILSNNSILTDNQTLTFGVHYKNEKGKFDLNLSNSPTIFQQKSEDTYALFFHHHFELTDSTILNSGFRAERSHLFGTNSSFKLGSSTKLSKETRLYSLISTGYKNPTLYQLHSQYGNKNLDPEKALSLEIGNETSLGQFDFGWNLNHTLIDDFIDLEGTYPNQKYQNSSELEVTSSGVQGSYQLTPQMKVKSNLDYTRAKNKKSGQTLLNRPKWAGKLSFEWINSSHELTSQFEAKGDRIGGSTSSPVELSGYGLIHLGYKYSWHYLEFFGNIRNLLDKNYVGTAGFNTGGRMIFAGVSASL